jgi:ABC-2 type transport system ATP-binding protein
VSEILEVKGLRKSYKDFTLKDISFSLEKGYIMGFIGPNGAGKSTTIKLIMNLLRKEAGSIKVFGLDNIRDEIEIKQRVGFVYDQNHFYDTLTVKEMKQVVSPIYRNWSDKLYRKYLDLFKLDEKKKIKDLSRGNQMKLSLTFALSHNADLLIMDEPTSGLDPVVRRDLLKVLGEFIQDESKGILFSTHITSDLDKIADYITFINNGEIILSQPKDDILDNYAVVKGDKALVNTLGKDPFISVRTNEFGFEALAPDRDKIKPILNGNVVLEKPTLEDIMLYYIEREEQ